MTKPDPKTTRYAEAYETLASHPGYCTIEPGLSGHAADYARKFAHEDDAMAFDLGCTNWSTSRAAVFMVEAIRALNCGDDSNTVAIELLQLAIAEIAGRTTPTQPDNQPHF